MYYKKIVVSYDGGAYFGFQRLRNSQEQKSIQGILEYNLSAILEEQIKISGSGRTDKGVHAFAQVIHIQTSNQRQNQEIKQMINNKLPEDIRILDIEETSKNFHSRYSAVSKTYDYYIDCREVPSVFRRSYCYPVYQSLEMEKMRKASHYLLGEHDFTSFCTKREKSTDVIRNIYSIKIEKKEEIVKIQIKGNGFLYHMVRIIVGTLLEVGLGKREPNEIKQILEAKNRQLAGPTICSTGLFLREVQYNTLQEESM